ncbi:amino acid adenylation domain-containing protein [Hyunsoonleella sp. SJ7]|uniref:Amino acid adenylation domain-containing protein n=1 Tax=Hyunsoonleella aquatilis TaxID=2762758 RepID=A0A923H8H6_9FLAO|nr:non-ribosomal peptide synthetase [Hyunsoonleella aquatilis]MBC3759106.1 amino acid adenylation domain-containing protein [Hyunsoonleella aquatilis]
MHRNYSPLTPSQKLLWIGQELNPGLPLYNMVMTYEIQDEISLPHFKEAFQKVVETCDVLRSVFKYKDDAPVQEFLTEVDYELDFKDLSKETDPKATYETWVKERSVKMFNLEKCAFDTVLIKMSDARYIWYLNQHHLISDGWSTSLVFTKMSECYAKALQNELKDAEAMPSFQEYVLNSNEGKAGEHHQKYAGFWVEKLKDFPETPSLYYYKTSHLDTPSKRVSVSLGEARTRKINALANQKGIRGWTLDLTLYNIFLTVLYAYVYRVSGQNRLTIGSPINNRGTKVLKNTVGLFIETFPLLVEIEEDETFMSLFKKVQLESNSFIKHAQGSVSTADLSRSFNVFFNYINNKNPSFNGAGVKTNWVHTGHHDPRHHLRLHVHDFDNTDQLQLYFDLNTNQFDSNGQELVPQHFLKMLDAIVEDSGQNIDTVSLITDTEISKIKSWNNTTVDYPEGETLLSKFKNQVQKTPDNVALVFKKETLSYRSLDEKSNQVAQFLIQKGIKRGDIVAISLERSIEMMVCIYGILKAGAAYLPLDISTPSERLKFILKDAKAKILFYNHGHIDSAVLNDVEGYDVAEINDEISSLSTSSVDVDSLPDDLAYVIYTSGSTGEPKGVMCHHKGICNRLNWMQDYQSIDQSDTLIQKTPITFDVSLPELFWPLQTGAKLVVEIPDGHTNPEHLQNTIRQNNISVIHFVPSMLNVFVQAGGAENCTSLKTVFCSGEALSVSVVERTYEKLNVEIYNLYGPTEASVEVSYWHCKRETLHAGIPIGTPVSNTQLHILDKNLNPLPIGAMGELHIAGIQVAKGYLNRKELTEERFIDDVFSDDPRAKMYKTGDLARYRPDGVIEYHGRIDNQIKLRGLRIELGEIEKNLEKIEAISQAVVMVDANENLLAYYLGDTLEDTKIAEALGQRLPLYMVPQFYMHLDQFEFLSSGKVDRKKLPTINLRKQDKRQEKALPKNEIEELVHGVWKEVLEIENIGVNENFFRIGGNSLNAISITSRLKAMLELEVPVTDVFNYPTIEAYSQNIEKTIMELLNE